MTPDQFARNHAPMCQRRPACDCAGVNSDLGPDLCGDALRVAYDLCSTERDRLLNKARSETSHTARCAVEWLLKIRPGDPT